jgi:hypothetical protein
VEKGRWRRAGGEGPVEKGRWRRAGGEGPVEKGRWKRDDGEGPVERRSGLDVRGRTNACNKVSDRSAPQEIGTSH